MNTAITLRQLRYLVAVADTLHFGRAAAACHVSQPSLSAQIQQLEEQLGVRLLERTRRGVLLTATGYEITERARRILDAMRDLEDSARHAARPLSGMLRLGVIPTLGPYLLPRVLPPLRRTHPDFKLYLREDLTDRLVDRLHAGALDVLLLALPVERPALESLALFDEPFVVAMPAGHRLANGTGIREDDLAGERLLLLEEGHCLRDQALSVCGTVAPSERETFGATSLDTLREMVACGIGITLLPGLATTGVAMGVEQVEIRPFAAPAPSRRIGLVWRRGGGRESEYRMLGDFIRDHLPPGAEAVTQPCG